jgi:hypothetical protein
MKILEYSDLDVSKVKRQYEKTIDFLAKDDFRSAEVKKLAEQGLFRAKLDDANRLLFKIMSFNGERYALILEAVLQHAYEKSKFLRGVRIDEAKIPAFDQAEIAAEDAPRLRYVNPCVKRFHFLDKAISFDPEQQELFRLPAPLIIIGPAGSGKTALTLEKMKRLCGRILYVTLSKYLTDNSRSLYYSHHYENDEQDLAFLSFRELIETMRVPEGREVSYRAFAEWLFRIPRQQRVADAHRLYEEFRGVLTGSVVDAAWLGREEYLCLGVKQSIFLDEERELVYTLFEKYLAWLKASGLYDPNILAHGYLAHARPEYDFIVVDEVQDITNIQLQLILKSLKRPEDFILCGDSNQVVHPNFFSWSGLKSMLYLSEEFESGKVTRVLQSNFRNATTVTALANKLLMIKQKRFGSLDRESNYLMNSVSDAAGEVVFMKDTERAKRDLSRTTRRSTKYAVLVMRDEDKAAARQFFDTPLLFSIHEAKGLEYENVILMNFITFERKCFTEIVEGIGEEDLAGELEYRRARDKTDKSHEVYKFFINSLYVAVTRAVSRIFLIEGDTGHPLISLLGLRSARENVIVEEKQSTLDEWQAEARRLEQQGRQEQADEIRRSILKTPPVPWEVCAPGRVEELLARARDPKDVSQKPRKALFEYALFHGEPRLIDLLRQSGFDKAKPLFIGTGDKQELNSSAYSQHRLGLYARYFQEYEGKFYQGILKQCETYGVDHRTAFNATPLMLAASAGNDSLVRELLARGANAELTDNYGRTAWQHALTRAAYKKHYAVERFPLVHELLAPGSVSLKAENRLIKIDASQGEFLLYQLFFSLLHDKLNSSLIDRVALTAVKLSEMVEALPDSVLPAYRRKRQYLSSLLSKNETGSTNPYGRKLFVRLRQGYYLLNPMLSVLHKDEWVPLYRYAGLELLAKSATVVDERFKEIIIMLYAWESGLGGARPTEQE